MLLRIVACLGLFLLGGCATAPRRLPLLPPLPAAEPLVCEEEPPPQVWLGFVVVEDTAPPGEPFQVVFLMSDEDDTDLHNGVVRVNLAQGLKVAGVRLGDYWQFRPPDNPKLSEVRVYADGRVFGVSEDEGPDCWVFYRANEARSRRHPEGGVVVTAKGVRGRLLLLAPPVFDHTEGSCRESPRRRPPRSAPPSQIGLPA